MSPDRAFTALLLISGVSAVTFAVLPPTNVTVSCQNLKVTVSWEYSKQQPQTSFSVDITNSTGCVETTDHQCDLSPFIWKSEDQYLGFHYVNIAAIQGGKRSTSVQSKTFSFNPLKTSNIECILDFPPVDLNVKDSVVTVSFRNPLHFYRELKQANKLHDVSFAFTVTSDNGDFVKDCKAGNESCKQDIPFIAGAEKCVKLKGLLHDGNNIGQVAFRETDQICVSKSDKVHVMKLVILLSVTAFVISVVTIFIWKAKAWTMNTPGLPNFLLPNHREWDLECDNVSDTDISAVRLIVNRPDETPSVSSEEENTPTENLQHRSAGSDFQHPAHSDMSGKLLGYGTKELEAVGLISEGNKDDDSADDSVKTECVSIDSEEERSIYDSPHTLQVEIDDGDMVTVYKEG